MPSKNTLVEESKQGKIQYLRVISSFRLFMKMIINLPAFIGGADGWIRTELLEEAQVHGILHGC